jgi:hypothetical protein
LRPEALFWAMPVNGNKARRKEMEQINLFIVLSY